MKHVECLTDIEKRIFLTAMGREAELCKKLSDIYPEASVPLVPVCNKIVAKVKLALWEE